MVVKTVLIPLLLVGLLPAGLAAAPEKPPSASAIAAGLPLTGQKPTDFVPKGWEIESSDKGDLNHDSVPDRVLSLTEHRGDDAPKKFDDNYQEPSHLVVVLLGEKGGGLRRYAVNARLWAPGEDTPSFEVAIKNGILLVNEVLGVGQHAEATFRYRHDAGTGKLLLIGFDYHVWHAQQPEQYRRSENYLTGVALDATGNLDGWKPSRRHVIKKTQVPFEKTRMNADNGVADVRPF